MEFWLARMKQVRVAIAETLAKAPRAQSLKVMQQAERHQASLLALGKLEKDSLKPLAMPVLPAWRSARLALALTAPTGPLSVP